MKVWFIAAIHCRIKRFSPASRIILIERYPYLLRSSECDPGFSPASRIILIERPSEIKVIWDAFADVSVPQAGLF